MRLNKADIRGTCGIVPTPATKDAANWRARDTIAVGETRKMVEAIVAAGIEIIMTTGTFGECATLTPQELNDFISCIVKAARGRVPVIAGITTLGTRETIDRGKALLDRGADGLFVGRPMWLPLDDDTIVRYYEDLAEALPDAPLVVYDNPSPFKGKISTSVYRRLAAIRNVVASKHVGGPALEEDMQTVGDQIVLLPLDNHWHDIARKFPDRAVACWSGNVACAPAPVAALSRAILGRDWTAAENISARLKWALAAQFPNGDFARFMNYSIQSGHARFRTAGLIKPGPCRPPYTHAPQDVIDAGEETGRRLAVLEKEFARPAAVA